MSSLKLANLSVPLATFTDDKLRYPVTLTFEPLTLYIGGDVTKLFIKC